MMNGFEDFDSFDSFKAEYNKLPECLKSVYSFKAYSSMPDGERMHLQENECLPDYEED